MHYDFDQIIDRSRNHSAKYDERKKKFGTDDVIPLWIADLDFKTAQPIIDALELRRPIYQKLAAYGHVGREELGVAWEKTDRADALRAALGL